MLFLRTTDKNGRAHGGFQWPMEVGAVVTAPDWRDDGECGGGLHGLLDGQGDSALLNWAHDALWWIVEATDSRDLGGKHKFASCRVVAVGDRHSVTARLYAMRPGPIHGVTATAGSWGTATAGDGGTAMAGDRGTAMAGDRGTATAGDWGTATAGDWGTATAGYRGTAMAGDRGTATAGDWGTATAGDRGTATAGDEGTATAGDEGTATAGDGGTLIFTRWKDGRRRVLVAYVGEDGIKSNQPYRANDDFTAVVPVEAAE